MDPAGTVTFLYKLKTHGEQVAIWKAKLLLGLRRFGH